MGHKDEDMPGGHVSGFKEIGMGHVGSGGGVFLR